MTDTSVWIIFLVMNSRQFKGWLAKQGCTFEKLPGGSGHLRVRLGDKKSILPVHGGRQQIGKGLENKIKKQLGLK